MIEKWVAAGGAAVFARYLRAALHAAADEAEPRLDGLDLIRARIRLAARVPACPAALLAGGGRG